MFNEFGFDDFIECKNGRRKKTVYTFKYGKFSIFQLMHCVRLTLPTLYTYILTIKYISECTHLKWSHWISFEIQQHNLLWLYPQPHPKNTMDQSVFWFWKWKQRWEPPTTTTAKKKMIENIYKNLNAWLRPCLNQSINYCQSISIDQVQIYYLQLFSIMVTKICKLFHDNGHRHLLNAHCS